jgi:hypothetical protein
MLVCTGVKIFMIKILVGYNNKQEVRKAKDVIQRNDKPAIRKKYKKYMRDAGTFDWILN